VGITRIEDGRVNICGLFRRRAATSERGRGGRDLLSGPPGSLLRRRLEHAIFDEDSFCSVAGLPLQPQRATGRAECCIGDALTMIPPVTGNGMSMAFEAAAAAVGPLEAYSRNDVSWEQARSSIAWACDRLFRRRLWWAGWLQRLMFSSCLQARVGRLLLDSECLWHFLFARTR